MTDFNVGNAFSELKKFLKEMFQFDENDLDFGIFKVMRLKRKFIEKFIDGDGPNDLKAIVANELSGLQNADLESARSWLENLAVKFGEMGKQAWEAIVANPNDKAATKKFKGLLGIVGDEEKAKAEQQIKILAETSSLSSEHLESKVYNYLLNFFELYYQNGDFGYNTRASSAFKVPYEADYDGSDTLFHWKHKDSYYIKTGNGFFSVKFDLLGQTIEFRAEAGGDADDAAQNNNKESSVKHYRLERINFQDGVWQVIFKLAKESTPKTEIYPQIWQTVFKRDDELSRYLFKKDGTKSIFNDLAGDYDKTDNGQVKGIGQLRLKTDNYCKELAKKTEFKDLGRNADKRAQALQEDEIAQALFRLDQNLNKFYVGMDADYFIHKDLRGFLQFEKDRFVKNVIFSDLDALLYASRDNSTILIARAFGNVAERIISFLDSIETFQRNLFCLKKKVVDTQWLLSTGKIPESFYPQLLENQSQLAEWKSVYGIDVKTIKDIKDNPTLVVDTKLFSRNSSNFVDDLLSNEAFDNLDEKVDGLLIHSENWQALNILQDKYNQSVKCICIDPPYNIGNDGFLFKDSFKHSSWISAILDRLRLSKALMRSDGVLYSNIDSNEKDNLEACLQSIFEPKNIIAELIWVQHTTYSQSPTYSTNHEYIKVASKNRLKVENIPSMFREKKPGYSDLIKLIADLNPQYPPVEKIEQEIKDFMAEQQHRLTENLNLQGIPYSKRIDPLRSLYSYRYAEYRDDKGNYIEEKVAKAKKAKIWVFSNDKPSMPGSIHSTPQ